MGSKTPKQDYASDEALVSLLALLEPAAFPLEDCLDALHRAQGDLSRAAELLLVPQESSSSGRKRKRDLESWLKPKTKAQTQASQPPSPSQSPSPSPSPQKPVDRTASAASWATLLSAQPRKPTLGPEKPLRSAPQRALHLATPAAIKAHNLPLAFLDSPLTPAFAAALYHQMLGESPSWPYNKFFLAGREVESNHQSVTYARRGGGFEFSHGGTYYYTGTTYKAREYPPLLEQAADMVEDAVNAYLESQPRYPLEYRGRWRANVCGANRYDGAVATVGYHADQLTYLGPYTTIASLSLGTPRAFRLRPVATVDEVASDTPPRTYEVTLGHNSLVCMTPGCQERYKHCVPPQRALDVFRAGWDEEGKVIPPERQVSSVSRINITFRFYREDFNPSPGIGPRGPREGTPHCKCGIPTLLRADQKAKARARMPVRRGTNGIVDVGEGRSVVDDDMVFFWQCQSPASSGDVKGCGFFKILDMKGEGRGPCWGDEMGVEGNGNRVP